MIALFLFLRRGAKEHAGYLVVSKRHRPWMPAAQNIIFAVAKIAKNSGRRGSVSSMKCLAVTVARWRSSTASILIIEIKIKNYKYRKPIQIFTLIGF